MDNVEKLIVETNIAKANLENAKYGDDLDENGNDVGMYFLKKANELAETRSVKGLFVLFDYFDQRFDIRFEGVLDRIQNDILNNFTLEQILEVFFQEFNHLLDKCLWRIAYICATFFWEQKDFDMLRQMFNSCKSKKSNEFLDELTDSIDDDYEVGQEGITLLREDMKKW